MTVGTGQREITGRIGRRGVCDSSGRLMCAVYIIDRWSMRGRMTRHALLMAELAAVVVVGFPPPVLDASNLQGTKHGIS